MSFRKLSAAALALAIMAGPSAASVLVAIDPAGVNEIRLQISGTYDVTGGSSAGPASAGSGWFGGSASSDLVQAGRYSGGASDSSSVRYNLTSGSGLILQTDILTIPTAFDFDNLLISFSGFGSGYTFLVGFDGANSGSLSEDITISGLDYASTFNSGVWEWGDPSVANGGIRYEAGMSAVPLPSALALLGGALGAIAVPVLRRRRQRT